MWKTIDDGKTKFDEDQLLDLFAAAAPAPPKPAAEAGPPVPEKAKVIELLDSNRTKALSIMVMRFRRPNEQVAEEIRRVEEKLSEEELSALKTNCPTAEEISTVLGFEGDRAQLGKAEQFVAALGTVKLLQDHINFLLLRKTFDDQMKDIERPLGIIIDGLLAIKNSALLKDLLALILRI
jgi:hypothetical protein